MNTNNLGFLSLRRIPARIDVSQTALLLGFRDHDIPVLVQAKLLKPLGDAAANAPKYFAACDIVESAENTQWLHRATKALSAHWRRKKIRSVKSPSQAA